MNKQNDEIDTLIGRWLACEDVIPDSASPDNDLSFSQQPIGNTTTNFRPHGPKPTYGPGAFSPLPDDEVISLFRYKAANFLEQHQKHTAQVDLIQPLNSRLGGCCRHLRDHLRRVLIQHVPGITAHINSNAPYERLCLACIRMRRNRERYQCTLCG